MQSQIKAKEIRLKELNSAIDHMEKVVSESTDETVVEMVGDTLDAYKHKAGVLEAELNELKRQYQ